MASSPSGDQRSSSAATFEDSAPDVTLLLAAQWRRVNGKITVMDGSLTESKEIVGGYAIMDVKSREGALALGRRFMEAEIPVTRLAP